LKTLHKNIFANLLAKGWGALTLIIATPFYIKYLGLESYGIIALFNALIVFMSVFDFGFGTTLNRYLAQVRAHPEQESESKKLLFSFELIYLLAGSILSIALTLSARWLSTNWLTATQFSEKELASSLTYMLVALIAMWPSYLYANGLKGLEKQVIESSISLLATTMRHYGSVLVFIFISPTTTSYFCWQLFTAILFTLSLRTALWKSLPKESSQKRFSLRLIKKHASFSAGTGSISLSAFVITQYDKIVLSKVLPLSTFACYSLASTLAQGLVFICQPIQSAYFPTFSRLILKKNTSVLSENYHQATQLMTALIIPVSVAIFFFAPYVLIYLIPDAKLVPFTAHLLRILILGMGLGCVMHLPYSLQMAAGWTKLFLGQNLSIILIILPAAIYLTPLYGGTATAYAWVAINLVYVLIGVPLMHTKLLPKELAFWLYRSLCLPTLINISIFTLASFFVPKTMFFLFAYIASTITFAILVTLYTMPSYQKIFAYILNSLKRSPQ